MSDTPKARTHEKAEVPRPWINALNTECSNVWGSPWVTAGYLDRYLCKYLILAHMCIYYQVHLVVIILVLPA